MSGPYRVGCEEDGRGLVIACSPRCHGLWPFSLSVFLHQRALLSPSLGHRPSAPARAPGASAAPIVWSALPCQPLTASQILWLLSPWRSLLGKDSVLFLLAEEWSFRREQSKSHQPCSSNKPPLECQD